MNAARASCSRRGIEERKKPCRPHRSFFAIATEEVRWLQCLAYDILRSPRRRVKECEQVQSYGLACRHFKFGTHWRLANHLDDIIMKLNKLLFLFFCQKYEDRCWYKNKASKVAQPDAEDI